MNIIWGYTTIKELLINEQIRAQQVRLIGSQGEALGVVSYKDAMQKAEEEGLDLVLMSPNAVPPVCKIMDYGKHRFDTLKKEKEAKKKQKVSEVKGMQLSMNIADNDMQFKAKNVRKFLLNGDKVKVSLRMFGRQLANPQMGLPIMEKFYEMLSDVSELTSKPEINGRQIVMVLSPKSTK
ncbi:MAG: translation initiation factor IF-3 [Clostridia bacterium]|nr:translation initiation factor IF-3 [Clostridia bacterium]